MRTVVLYRKDSDAYPAVRSWLEDFARVHPDQTIEQMDPDSREGIAFAETYQQMQFPAVLTLSDDGVLMQKWQGAQQLPSLDSMRF